MCNYVFWIFIATFVKPFFKRRWHSFLWVISPALHTVALIPILTQFVSKQSSSLHAVSTFFSNWGKITNKSWYYICKPKWRFPRTQFCLTTNTNSSKWKEIEKNTNKYLKIGCEKRKKRLHALTVSLLCLLFILRKRMIQKYLWLLYFPCFLYLVFYVPIIKIGKWYFRKTSGLDGFTTQFY